MVSVIKEQKYFLEASAYSEKQQFTENLKASLIVDEGKRECLEYTIVSVKTDFIV